MPQGAVPLAPQKANNKICLKNTLWKCYPYMHQRSSQSIGLVSLWYIKGSHIRVFFGLIELFTKLMAK